MAGEKEKIEAVGEKELKKEEEKGEKQEIIAPTGRKEQWDVKKEKE